MNDLQFQECIRPRFRSFYKRNIDQMSLLLDDGRVPMTPKQLLYERVHGANEHDRNLFCDNYVDTACAVITDESGEVLIGLCSDPLVKVLVHNLNPTMESRLQNGSLPVDSDVYQEIRKKAFAIPCDAAANLRNSYCNELAVREGFWDYVTEGDADLVRDHLSLVQERIGGSMENRMGLLLSSYPGLRLLCAWSVGGYLGGGAGGDIHLVNCSGGRLVGVDSAGGAQWKEGARERAAQKSGPYREPSYPPRPSLEETLTVVLPTAKKFAVDLLHEGLQEEMIAGLSELYRSK